MFKQVGIFAGIIVVAVSISVFGLYLNEMLQLKWRTWLTDKYLSSWLSDRAYYYLQTLSTTDNLTNVFQGIWLNSLPT